MITFNLYWSDSTDGWHANMPGACGSGASPWEALAEALAVWERRGRPETEPEGIRRGGADWVIDHVVDRGPGYRFRYHVRGVNLNQRPGGYGRVIDWDILEDPRTEPRYEILPGAWDSACWKCPGKCAA